MNFNLNLGRKGPDDAQAPLRLRSDEARAHMLDVGLEGLEEVDRQLVLFDYLAAVLDAKARARTPSLVVRLGPWVLGGGSFGAVWTWLHAII